MAYNFLPGEWRKEQLKETNTIMEATWKKSLNWRHYTMSNCIGRGGAILNLLAVLSNIYGQS